MRTFPGAAWLTALLVLASLAPAGPTQAADSSFAIEWKLVPGPRGDNLEGFVYNRSNQPTDHVRLSIEAVDAAGQVIGRSTAWVLGAILPNNRTWFTTPVPASGAATFRVEILSFDWAGLGA